jgi:hypothetical protein
MQRYQIMTVKSPPPVGADMAGKNEITNSIKSIIPNVFDNFVPGESTKLSPYTLRRTCHVFRPYDGIKFFRGQQSKGNSSFFEGDVLCKGFFSDLGGIIITDMRI